MLSSKFLVIPKFQFIVVRNISFKSLFSKEQPEIKPVEYQIEFAKAADAKPTLEFIEKNFFVEEPLSKSLYLTKRSLEGCVEIFVLDAVRNGMTLLAKTKSDEIIGACVNIRSCPFDARRYKEFAKCSKSDKTKKLFHIWSLLAKEPRLHEDLNEHCIFEIKMLTVGKLYQRQGLGTELMKKSLELARDLNFSYATTNCTNEYAKIIAERQDMKPIWEAAYKNILLSDGKTPVSTPEHPHLSASVSYLNLKKLE